MSATTNILPVPDLKNPEDYKRLEEYHIGSAAVGTEAYIDTYSLISNYLHGYGTFSKASEAARELDTEHEGIPAYELRRMPLDAFLGVLVDSRVMSQELVDSGILSRFSPDRRTMSEGVEQFRGGFRHIFLGGIGGGLHDVDTLVDAGLAGPGTDTVRTLTDRGIATREKTGTTEEQNPDLRTGTGVDTDGDGDTDLVRLRSHHAKSQFPEHWTTDRVILAIVSVADSKGVLMDPKSTHLKHTATVVDSIDGKEVLVKITVFTDKETGLIEDSYVSWGSKRIDTAQAIAA